MSYWLTRVVFLRCLAGMYVVAFLVAYLQNEYLLGDNGLTPAKIFISSNRGNKSDFQLILSHPTLFWVISPTTDNLNCVSLSGLLLSLFVCIQGSANVPILLTLWALYFSIVNVGQTWYSFGWESQLLESGILAVFMVPILSLARYPKYTPTPAVCIWGYRWLLFRIMLGAGMIKIRGDECWRDLTCMYYHYETQPVPNPLSVFFHFNPALVHRLETAGNHVVELLCPWLLLIPHRGALLAGGAIQILFQCVLIASGNLSFLNWLTALPAVACFDDAALAPMFSKREAKHATEAEAFYRREVLRVASQSSLYCAVPSTASQRCTMNSISSVKPVILSATASSSGEIASEPSAGNTRNSNSRSSGSSGLTLRQRTGNALLSCVTYDWTWFSACALSRRMTGLLVCAALAVLSYPVIRNIASPNQHMNVTFEPFRLVNSYGAFGSVTKIRHEVILQGTNATDLRNAQWLDFEFACKPGDINRRPCMISPYHIRIDWLMWFAAFQSYQHCPWMVHLVDKLLRGTQPAINRLLAPGGNPFFAENHNSTAEATLAGPLRFMRAELYEYQYASLSATQGAEDAAAGWEVGLWWKRRHVRNYMPEVEPNNTSVKQFLLAHRLVES